MYCISDRGRTEREEMTQIKAMQKIHTITATVQLFTLADEYLDNVTEKYCNTSWRHRQDSVALIWLRCWLSRREQCGDGALIRYSNKTCQLSVRGQNWRIIVFIWIKLPRPLGLNPCSWPGIFVSLRDWPTQPIKEEDNRGGPIGRTISLRLANCATNKCARNLLSRNHMWKSFLVKNITITTPCNPLNI